MNRFIAEDPIGLYGGINLYAYTLGAPTNYFDPTGEAVQLYTPDIYFDLASIGYDLYRLAADGRKGLKTNLTALGADLCPASPTPARRTIQQPPSSRSTAPT
jgi:uncharacterized protein RhaS with RHS repeats